MEKRFQTMFTVPDSANGSSQNNVGYSVIHCQALDRPAWKYYSEEQRWHPTLHLHMSQGRRKVHHHGLKSYLNFGMETLILELYG